VIGVDWQFPMAEARKRLPASVALQGNLAPSLLSDATPKEVAREATRLLVEMRDRPGYIFNLGHGLTPKARLECIESLVNTVRRFK
jgi:uroporphyrinogen decarboxylase